MTGPPGRKRKMTSGHGPWPSGGAGGGFTPKAQHCANVSPTARQAAACWPARLESGQDGPCVIKPHFPLLRNDYLRIGTEDERWHSTMSVKRDVPKAAAVLLSISQKHKTPKAGVPVFLRSTGANQNSEKIIREWRRAKAEKSKPPQPGIRILHQRCQDRRNLACARICLSCPGCQKARAPVLSRCMAFGQERRAFTNPLRPNCAGGCRTRYLARRKKIFRQGNLSPALRAGARHFVCNAPWQAAFFTSPKLKDLDLVAGPFLILPMPTAIMELESWALRRPSQVPNWTAKICWACPGQSPLPLGLVYIRFFGQVGLFAIRAFGHQVYQRSVFQPQGRNFLEQALWAE